MGSRGGVPRRTCAQPDRDVASLVCGYPLPCPWHTAVIDLSAEPPAVTVPLAGPVGALVELRQIGLAVSGKRKGVRRGKR